MGLKDTAMFARFAKKAFDDIGEPGVVGRRRQIASQVHEPKTCT